MLLIDRPVRAFAGLLFLWFIVYAFFRDFPSVDIAFSNLFFTETTCAEGASALRCGTFAAGEHPILSAIRTFLFFLPGDLVIAMLVWSIDVHFRGQNGRYPVMQHNVRILIATWIISVAIIVNMLLKANSARPRPAATSLFGGDMEFKAVADFGGACTSNCSFISGEAASAGWLICALAILSPRLRRILFVPVVAAALLTVFLRVMFGRHFLSDALLGFLSAPVVFLFLIAIFGWKKADEVAR
ncbi:phosphatase PAP2 family protein [Rhizobium sp. L1K21]|uniref:phosphatase PAP2 family protein n=1 Tax=Rhizobium sp. L1K21 TaxID=2954933 RepID=UPI0020922C23|nr:phosphatase PAP2 family protein [Rhizobium sp. L1K21]MCO6186514.1 phosphatase PAP2 family protein [Rhizobium sp. L1K21]